MEGAAYVPPGALPWYAAGDDSAAVRHVLPEGTTQVAAAFAGYTHRCNLRIFNASGAEEFFLQRFGDDNASVPNPVVRDVDTSSGPAFIQFDEPAGRVALSPSY